MMKKCFPPIIDKRCKILIFGSFPGQESLRKKQYYAHPQNQFWRLLSDITGDDFKSKSYAEKKKLLLKNHIAVWDVIAECEREGSLDSDIKNHRLNDLKKALRLAPKLELICFNGNTSGKYRNHFEGIRTTILPSSSPAYTKKYEDKLRLWKKAFKSI